MLCVFGYPLLYILKTKFPKTGQAIAVSAVNETKGRLAEKTTNLYRIHNNQ